MIFDISPSQIQSLDSGQLVKLLRKLLHAEAQRAGISLRSVSVPLQITVPDGGEDARISWSGGLDHTDYLPSRFCVFQAKATDPGRSGWKKEAWTRGSRKKGVTRKLSKAVTKTISERGSYIGFTSDAVIGDKYDERIEGIKEGIREAGANPDDLKAIDLYDANRIAAWASGLPAIAVWLNEQQSGLVLRGFQTVENWGKKPEIYSIKHVEDSRARFSLGGQNILDQQQNATPATNALTYQQAKERIGDYLVDFQKCVRLIGPSGIGKTRFVHEVLKDASTIGKISLSTSAFYCDFRDIAQISQIAQSLSESQNPGLMIVDECPHEVADKLCEIVTTENSQLRVLTIGNDDRPIKKNNCLNLAVSPADDALIEGIVRQRLPKADDSDISFIKNLSGGYPRIAVLATDNYSENAPILKSIDEVVERILTGCNINQGDQIRAIECLALFDRLGADEELSGQLDFVAEKLARQTGDQMYEHLAKAAEHQIVDHRGRFFTVQPLPIAAFLGARRIDLLRIKTILHFIESAPPDLLFSFLSQWRHFDVSTTAVTVASRLLQRDGQLGSLENLNTEFGSKCLDALVHANPDEVSDTVNRVFGALSIEELTEIKAGRRYLVWALEKLVFRKSSFSMGTRLLMRLAAAENETWSNNATGLFKQLFQLHLSGTEVEPSARFAVLDGGISSGDDRIISVCVEALESTLSRGHASRSGGSEQIGSQAPLKDWHPKLWKEVFDFQRDGLKRLLDIRGENEKFATRCERIIASHIRPLLCENLFSDIEKAVQKIKAEKGIWLEAIEGVGDWLYFDRKGAPEHFSRMVRGLYDSLIPIDPVQKALLYTKFWSADIHDPDSAYDPGDSSTKDFEYSSQKAREVATEIAADKELSRRAIQVMAVEDLHNAFPFAHELSKKVEDPIEAFRTSLQVFEKSADRKGLQFLRGMLAGIDERDRKLADECIKIARASDVFKNQAVNIYTAVRISPERFTEIVQSLKEGGLAAADCAFLSYGRGLDNLSAQDILPLIIELVSNHEAEGIWTALEIISMYQHGRKELDENLAEQVRQQITSPQLLGKARRGAREGHLFESLTFLVHKHFGIDDNFAIELSKQFTRLCQAEDHDVFFALDDPVRKIIKLLVQEKPLPLWEVFSRFFEIATPLEAHRLEDLVGPPSHGFDGESHNKEGALFGIPDADCIAWAKADPAVRAPFLCRFYPVFETNKTGGRKWHPALEKLAKEFGTVEKFRQALGRRLHPRSWWGSLTPHLEIYLAPLKEWFAHSVPEMSLWARAMHRSLEKQIAKERNLEDEGSISRS